MTSAPPPQKRSMSRPVMVATAAGAVAAALLMFLVVANLAGSDGGGGAGGGADGSGAGGDRRRAFVVGRANHLSDSVARHGPLLFQDPLKGSLNIYVQHLGGETWTAFESRPPGAPARCQLEWRKRTRDFFDACSGRVYPADGAGLVSFPTRVDEKKRVLVDLTRPVPPVALP